MTGSDTMPKLFAPYQLGNIKLKNRIVMSPMCTYSCGSEDGSIDSWHLIHYGARAVGQVGMIIVEATAVSPEGRISRNDLGLWSDDHIAGMHKLAQTIRQQGCVPAIQLAHAGRKAGVEGAIAPSALAFNEKTPVPQEMNQDRIDRVVDCFRQAARRAKEAGFAAIEIHGAHGYLLNQFLSPLANGRQDDYGGTLNNRCRLLNQVVEAVRAVWQGPLLVRLSVEEYHPEGNHPENYVQVAAELAKLGVDLIDCSSGGVVPAAISPYPGYQVPYAELLRRDGGVATGAVGLITSPLQAEEILANERADLVLLGRELLRNPNWPLYAAQTLGEAVPAPRQYQPAWNK